MIYQPHSDKQELAIFSEARITVCGTGIQWGKGLPLNELVLTPDGYREVRTIELGDTLYDRQGLPTKVIGVYPQGVRPCYKIAFTDGSDLITDDNHLNVVIVGNKECLIPTKQLSELGIMWGHAAFPGFGTPDKVILNVAAVEPRHTSCFSVDSPTKTYIARGQIVTHNTDVGAVRTKIAMHTHTHPDDNFLILAPSYKIMKQSSLPAFLRLMNGYGKYNKSDAIFEMYGGGTCWMRTATDPDSIVGMRNVRHIWGDEAGLFSLYFWENIQARAAPREAPIVLTTSPYSLNWVYKELIRGVVKGERPDVCYIKARSDENPYFPRAEYERRRATMDERRFRMVFGGEFEKMEGLVYDCYSEAENTCEWPANRDALKFYAGIDWGYTEPFAMVVHGIAPDGSRYQVSEVKKSRLTLTDIIDLCRQKMQVFGIRQFFCDPSQPGYIEELNRAGIPASPANNDIKHGVAKVYEEIKSRRLKFVRGSCPHTIDELETYHYPDPKDETPDKSVKDSNPVGQNDHVLDSCRYLIVSTVDLSSIRAPFVPGERQATNNVERIERLLKKPRYQSE